MRRACRFETFVVAGLLAASLLAAPAAAIAVAPVPNSAASSPRLKYLPEDYFAVVECNVGAVMQVLNAVGAQQNPQFAQFEQYMQMAQSMTGIDPQKDITWTTLIAAGTPGAGASPLVVIQGTFDNGVVQQHMTQLTGGAAPTDYKGQKIYTTPGADVAFPEPSTIVFGDPDKVRAAIDRIADGSAALPEELKNVLDRTPATSIVWAACKPSTLLDATDEAWQTENEELYTELSKLDCASLYFSIASDGLMIKTLGYVEDGAESVGKYLADRKNNVLHEEGSNVVFASLLIFTDVSTSDNYVEGAFRLTGEALHELWNTRLIVAPE